MDVRRRVKAAHEAEAILRSLINGAPVGLGLFRRDGTLLIANRPLARILGYESPAELLRVGGALGVFASVEEPVRALSAAASTGPLRAIFRHKNGEHVCRELLPACCEDDDTAVLVVFDGNPSLLVDA